MSTVIKKSPGGGIMLVYGNNSPTALLQISSSSKINTPNGPGVAYTGAKPSTEEEEGKKEWIPWGVNDDFPKQIAKTIRKTTVGRAGLNLITKSLYGQRLITYKIEGISGSGKEEIKLVSCPEWEEIMQRSNMDLVRLALNQDYAYYQINMPQIRFNGNKTKIWSFEFHKMSHCRFAPIDSKTGRIPYVYVSGNFPDAKANECQKIPVIDALQYYDQIEEIKADTKNFKYVFPQSWPDVINDYYPVAFWDSARESGWLDIAISIPAYKKALFKNQMSLKYHIDIPIEYFEDLYKNWKQMSDKEKEDIIGNLYNDIVSQLTGAENAQKALMSFSRTGANGQAIGKWTINVIDDKMKAAAWLPDAAAANYEILFAMGVNPAMTGSGNSGGSHAGGANNGGSNIRESGLQMRSLLRPDRDINLGFFNFFKAYQGIDPGILLGVQDVVLTTVDQGKGTEKIVS